MGGRWVGDGRRAAAQRALGSHVVRGAPVTKGFAPTEAGRGLASKLPCAEEGGRDVQDLKQGDYSKAGR